MKSLIDYYAPDAPPSRGRPACRKAKLSESMLTSNLPKGVTFQLLRLGASKEHKAYYVVSGRPGGVAKSRRLRIWPGKEDDTLAAAIEIRKEWEKTSRPHGGQHQEKRIRINPDSVPDSMKFKGLLIPRNHAVVAASRGFRMLDAGKRRYLRIYLFYSYGVGNDGLPSFWEALNQCRRGQGVLDRIPSDKLPEVWAIAKEANRQRKSGENIANALLSFTAFDGRNGTMQDAAAVSSAYDQHWKGGR